MARKHHLPFALLFTSAVALGQSPSIVGYEYWFDQNDAARTYVAVDPAQVVDLNNVPLNMAALLPGQHIAHLRLKDRIGNTARWSSVVSRSLVKGLPGPWQITAVRYWIGQPANDQDPVIRYKYFDAPQTDINYQGVLDLCGYATGNQTLKLQLRDNHGQWSSVVARSVNVAAAGPPGIPTIEASTSSFCPGEVVTFTAVPSTGGTAASWAWSIPVGSGWSLSGPGNGPSIQVVVGNTGGNITVVSNNACGTSPTSAPFTVAIGQAPVISVSDGQPTEVCPDASGLSYAVVPSTDGWTYQWSGPAGWNFSGNGASVTASTGGSPQAGTITVTATNTCGQTSAPVSIPVSIVPPPDMAGPISGPDELCVGSTGTFTVAPIANAASYEWIGAVGTGNTATATADSSGVLVIIVQGFNACGIPGVGSEPFLVNMLPAPGPVTITGSDSACAGSDVQYTATVSQGSGATFDWEWPNGFTNIVESGETLSASIDPGAVSGAVQVTVDFPVCGPIQETLPVTVLHVPDISGSTLQGDGILCAGSSGNFWVLPPVAGAPMYLWATSTDTITSGYNVTLGTGPSDDVVSVSAFNSCGHSDTLHYVVWVETPPQQPVIEGLTELCNADSTVLSVQLQPGETCVWNDGTDTYTVNPISVTTPGTWTATVSMSNACPPASASTQVVFEHLAIDSIAGPTNIADGGPYTYTVVPALDPAITCVWDIPSFASGTSSSGTIELTFAEAGTAMLCVTADGNVCPDTTACTPVIASTVMVAELEHAARWSVYPVPAHGSITIDTGDPSGAGHGVWLEDALGRPVLHARLNGQRTTINVSRLAAGTYSLRRDGRQGVVSRIVVSH